VVEKVKAFPTKLQPFGFGEDEVLAEGPIQIYQQRTANDVRTCVSETAAHGRGERPGVVPLRSIRIGHVIIPRDVRPLAKVDPRLDPKLSRAATIADERARAHSKSRCWRYVKEALLASGAVTTYPKTSLAKEAGDELVRDYGFKKLPIQDPYAAPVGSVLVYFKGRNRPGHVEIRTKTGFVSDFRSKVPCKYALIGVYAKR